MSRKTILESEGHSSLCNVTKRRSDIKTHFFLFSRAILAFLAFFCIVFPQNTVVIEVTLYVYFFSHGPTFFIFNFSLIVLYLHRFDFEEGFWQRTLYLYYFSQNFGVLIIKLIVPYFSMLTVEKLRKYFFIKIYKSEFFHL